MTNAVKNYFWKNGLPVATQKEEVSGISYKIIADPYYKHISIEKYKEGLFCSLIYDSSLLDFRQLHPEGQIGWERILHEEKKDRSIFLLKDQNDRLRVIETCLFEEQICRKCLLHSPHGALLSQHNIFYMALGDAFNGVELYDSNEHMVLRKLYEPISDEVAFGALVKEDWTPTDGDK